MLSQMRNFIVALALLSPTLCFAYIGGAYVGDALPSAVRINSLLSFCTGVKVSDHFLLTAAHCTLTNRFQVGDDLKIVDSTGSQQESHFVSVKIKNVIFHPSWTTPIPANDNYADLMLLEVDGDLSLFAAAKIDLRPLNKGDKIVAGGFGCKGSGYPAYPHMTVAVKLISDVLGNYSDTTAMNADGKTLSMGCSGDSGGPAYRLNHDGDLSVVGINHAVNVLESQMTVNLKDGALEKYSPEIEPILRMARLGFEDAQDRFKVMDWLRSNLPLSSFSQPSN